MKQKTLQKNLPEHDYKQYALDVQNGKITACKYIKQATARYLEWFERDDLEFRSEKVDRVVNFISKLRHYKGKDNKKPFKLLPYQLWIVASIFGFYYKDTEKRVIKYVYCELARKQGKTALMAAICLYMLIADYENGSEVYLVANSAKQAKICFEMSSAFLSSIDPKAKYFKRYRDSVKFDKTKSFIQVLAADASTNDGYNPYCFCLDEAHEQRDSLLWDVMVSGQGTRTNPLGIIITTAGFNKYGFCYNYRSTCLEILSGVKENDSQFAAIFTLDEEDNYQDEECWIKANPSLGITVEKDYLRTQVKNAINNSALEVGVRTKNFNQWVSSIDTWITQDTLLSSSKKIDLKDYKESIAYLGVDLGAVSDLTALSCMIQADDTFYFKSWYFLPQSALSGNPNAELYKQWKREGHLIVTAGNVTDYDEVTKKILQISDYLFVDKIAYDSYNSTQWAIDCTNKGLPLYPYSQALWNFNKPTKELERLIKKGKVVIDNNPVTRWCFSNVSLKTDHNDNAKPVKSGGQKAGMNKIDGVISMIEALGAYLDTPQYSNTID